MSKLTKQVLSLAQNKYILYVVFFLAITNVLGFLSIGDFQSIIFFIATVFLSGYFNKNMVINLVIAMVLTNMVFAGKTMEAMTNNNGKKKDNQGAGQAEGQGQAQAQGQGQPPKEAMDVAQKNGKEQPLEGKGKAKGNGNGNGNTATKKENFGQRNVPPSEPASLTKEEEDEDEVGKRIDYASTLEQAYSNLQNMLGKDGVSGLTKETEKLIQQQKNLMGTVNEMIPFIQSTKETLSSFNMGDLNKSIGSITKMLGGMGGIGGK